MISVVFHEGGSTDQARTHHLHCPHQGRRLPVALSTKPIVLRHQALDRETRQLCQAVQVLEGGGEGFEMALFQEMPQTSLNTRPLTQGLILAASTAQGWSHLIPFVV